MNVVPEPLPGGSPLARDYIENTGSAAALLAAPFNEPDNWSQRALWLDEHEQSRADRSAITDVLRTYNRLHNSDPAVLKSLDLLEQPGTLVVAGGQQSGLFTGPLLVIYKAATLISAAREASARLGRPVVPLFWIAGEDHDWDEVNHTYMLERSGDIAKLRIQAAAAGRSPVSGVKVSPEEWSEVLEQLENVLQDSEFKSELMDMLRKNAAESDTMTEAFAKLMGRLFGPSGLILLDSADPALRRLEVPMFRTIIEENDALEAAYRDAAGAIVSSGYSLQAEAAEDGANLFYIHEGSRLLLHKREGRFTDRKGLVAFTREELLAVLEAHPERFSNNVLTRPLMQDYVLPVLATCLGQGEIAYWAITHKAFEAVGGQMPLILPRMSFTLIEGTLQKHMDKYGLTFADVAAGLADKREEWLKAQDALQLGSRFEEARQSFSDMYDPLIEQLGSVQAGLLKLGNNNKEKILDQITFLENKALDALAKQNEAALRQWDKIEASLMPHGKPQERVYNILSYLNRYGFSWLDELLGVPAQWSGGHRIIYM